MKGAKTADEFILENDRWQAELILLRDILVSTGLDETIKWGVPVYVHESKNIAGIAAFKNYVGLWFYQGATLKDEAGKLISAQEGVTRALRQWRFGSAEEIITDRGIILDYVSESVSNLNKGVEIKPEKNAPLNLPEELSQKLEEDDNLNAVFESLSLSKRRDFAEYIRTAKREETRIARLEKIIPMILRREGLHDRYSR